MNILLTGASGFIGQHLTKKLRAAGHHINGISRSNGYDFKQMTNKETWRPLLNNIDVVINCVGIISETPKQSFEALHHQAPAALFQACIDADVKRVIQISALGADEYSTAPYHISKKAADDVLRVLPLQWFVLRPSLVYGKGGKSTAFFKRLAQLPVLPLMEGGKQMIQPVYINDLIDTVMHCLTSNKTNITIDVVGAHAISFKNWLQLMRESEGKSKARIISIPFKLSLAVAKFAQYFIPLMQTENIRMLQKGNYADVKPLAEFIGHMPLDIKTGWSKL